MPFKSLLVALGATLAFAACRGVESKVAAPAAEGRLVQSLEFRTQVRPDAPGATEFQVNGQPLFLGPPTMFRVSSVEVAKDDLGYDALAFAVAPSEREAFGDYTESLIHQPMAILFDGEVLTMPTVQARLTGGGVINGGARGFEPGVVEDLVARMVRSDS